MGKVIANMSMSLDGFVMHPTDGVNLLFEWYQAGAGMEQNAAKKDADGQRDGGTGGSEQVGALLYGRVTFDYANGWGGHHPTGAPVVVLTHRIPDGWPPRGSSVEFVTEGVERAVQRCQELAGDGVVAVGSADLMQQCLNAGLLDEIRVDLVPVLLGEGVRYFEKLADTPAKLSDPTVEPGHRVTHLHYKVRQAQ